MASPPHVTVAIPVHDGARYLAEAIDSARAQSVDRLEILVVDDGSTDESWSIISQRAGRDSRLRAVRHEGPSGMVANWNRCLGLARGEWIQFLFQDDVLTPDSVSTKLELAGKHDVSLVIADRAYRYEPGSKDARGFLEERLPRLARYYPVETRLAPESVMHLVCNAVGGDNIIGEPIVGLFKRTLIETYGGFDSRLRQLVDYEFWLRLCCNESFAFTPRVLAWFRVHGRSATARAGQPGEVYPGDTDWGIMLHLMSHDPRYRGFREYLDRQGLMPHWRRACRKFLHARNDHPELRRDILQRGGAEMQAMFHPVPYWLFRVRSLVGRTLRALGLRRPQLAT